jgi:hypothetical protein
VPPRRLSAAAAVATVVLTASVALAGVSTAAPPSEPECLPLGAGTTGVLVVGGEVPSGDQLRGESGGLGAPAPADVAATLPDVVTFKTTRETFSNEYAFALRRGRIYVRPALVGRGEAGEPWRRLEVPSCLDGTVTAISADHRFLVALGPGRQVYSHDMPGGDLSAERWTWRWGPYFWTGSGMTMFPDVRRWATSEFTSSETFTDTSGRRHHPIGVGTVYLLRGDGRITYLDPWLPQDQSREVCGPRRGTLPIANLSASGSTVFVVDERGGLFTRLYDFDVSGANTVFGDYSWERHRPASDERWQLPGPGWVRHPRPPGTVTDRISIAKTGPDAADRLMRVEGSDGRGRRVVWEKRIGQDSWRAVARGGRPEGRPLPLSTRRGPSAPADLRYAGTVGGTRAVVPDFNAECSPASLRVQVADGLWLRLRLHSSDGMRQEVRERGLTDVPREYNGAIEVPARVWRSLDTRPRLRRWVETHLDGRFTTAPLAVTATRMRFLAQCWELTLDGGAARPDQPAVPPDLGVVVGRLTEMYKDGRRPAVCTGAGG